MTAWADLRRDRVVWEHERALALDKPHGISVMGERHGTDVVRLAAAAGEELRWVHRIDKVTSGVVLLARDAAAHAELTRLFARRSVDKAYLAVVHGRGLPPEAEVDLPLRTAGSGRVRVAAERSAIRRDPTGVRWSVPPEAVTEGARSHPSVTTVARLWEGENHTVLLAVPVTGRRHQLRVHLAWIGHAITGDPLFDRAAAERGERTCLHAWRLGFDSPWQPGARVSLEARPPADLWLGIRDELPAGGPATVLAAAARAAARLATAPSSPGSAAPGPRPKRAADRSHPSGAGSARRRRRRSSH